MSAGVRDVARAAGVSVGTVSNVLNHPEQVAPATRDRVRRVMAELGFVRNEAARLLRSARGTTVGLLTPELGDPASTAVTRAAEQVVERSGAVLALLGSGGRAERERRQLRHLEEQRVRGLLVTLVDERSPDLAAMLDRGTPAVVVDSRYDLREVCSVVVDHAGAGRLVAQHLREHARTVFAGPATPSPRVASFAAGLEDASSGRVERLVVEQSVLSVRGGRALGALLAARRPADRPTALVCAHDLMALGAVQALQAAGLRVPDDVAVVGSGELDAAAAASVPLTSVDLRPEVLGRTAAELLVRELQPGEHEHRAVVLEPSLVVRASTGGGA